MSPAMSWQHMTLAFATVAVISLIMNIISISLLAKFRMDVDEALALLKDDPANGGHGSGNSSIVNKKIAALEKDLALRLENLNAKVEAAASQRNALTNSLDEVELSLEWMKLELGEGWKKGCPQGGVTNGTICYVAHRVKANYTEAVERCEKDGGKLATIHDQTLLRTILSFLPPAPVLVDARFNTETGLWKTSDGEDASFLPWSISNKGTGGECVYAYGEGYSRWHCHALLYYLCMY
ncbi:uncharacterized protein LOC100176455 [Ciona intestinalis]